MAGDDDLVECPECGREGLPSRIEQTKCPYTGFVSALRVVRGP